MTKFKERLKELRTEKELSQTKLVQKLGVDFRTVSNWECGTNEPSFDVLIKIAQYFDETIDYLLGIID